MYSFFGSLLIGLLTSCEAMAGGPPALASLPNGHLPGGDLSILWSLPFAGILLTLSLAPLTVPRFWHTCYGRISLFWAVATLLPIAFLYGPQTALYETAHTYFLHFIPFIILVGSLYTISGGVKIDLAYPPSPVTNTLLMLVATLVASWIGTTGAAMIFIRPLLEINASRSMKTHTVIFFILLVCNIGGALTALGDPPLFLGFLNGIDFFWPTTSLFLPFVLISGPLLALYFLIDMFFFRKDKADEALRCRLNSQASEENNNANAIESPLSSPSKKEKGSRLQVSGKRNLIFLAIGIGAVLLSGLWKPGISFSILGVSVGLESIVRDVLLVLMSLCSWRFGPQKARQENHFTWEPLLEVARLFATIFITAIPVIAILQAGSEGSLKSLVSLVSHEGSPVNVMYFWLTGLLSAFLDNAPTYLVFFNMAGGNAETLMGPLSQTLVAISAGSVFMGALTYIGNAPNFMVKAIAESKNVAMPGFFGYMIWSCVLLLPLFLLVTFVLF